MADGAGGELHVEAELVRHELFLGVEHHFLGDLFAGVGGGAGKVGRIPFEVSCGAGAGQMQGESRAKQAGL